MRTAWRVLGYFLGHSTIHSIVCERHVVAACPMCLRVAVFFLAGKGRFTVSSACAPSPLRVLLSLCPTILFSPCPHLRFSFLLCTSSGPSPASCVSDSVPLCPRLSPHPTFPPTCFLPPSPTLVP